MNTTLIHRLLCMVLLALAGAFALSLGVGLLLGERWSDPAPPAFAGSIATTLALAGLFHLLGRRGETRLFRREALCAIGLSWIFATVVGALPYYLAIEDCPVASAVFESASGFTTTGATAFPEFHRFPGSLLFWRSLSQWMGGLGVVVFFVALLSSLGAGAKILFSHESSGASTDFEQGRIQRGAFVLLVYYLGLTTACLLAYRLGGMTWFQAVNHAMTTTATGGFGTEAGSFEAFNSPALEWTATVFMALSATTFVTVIRLLRRRSTRLRDDHEVLWFYAILVASTLLLALYLVDSSGRLPDHDSIRAAAFQAVSIMTTTGFSSVDFDTWLAPAKTLLLILMFIGGCSGSTGGGVKVVRVVIALRATVRSVIHAFRPQLTVPLRVGARALGERAIQSTSLFLLLMVAVMAVSMLVVSASEPELSFLGVVSAVQASLFNIGPGFDAVGPARDFAFLRDSTKLYLSLLMIMGRLEIYAVFVLFIPSAWKRFS